MLFKTSAFSSQNYINSKHIYKYFDYAKCYGSRERKRKYKRAKLRHLLCKSSSSIIFAEGFENLEEPNLCLQTYTSSIFIGTIKRPLI